MTNYGLMNHKNRTCSKMKLLYKDQIVSNVVVDAASTQISEGPTTESSSNLSIQSTSLKTISQPITLIYKGEVMRFTSAVTDAPLPSGDLHDSESHPVPN